MITYARVDEKGRITLPKKVRRILGIQSGDELSIRIVGNKVVIEKSVNPFQRLEELLGDTTFKRDLRYKAEEEALKEVSQRLREYEEESSS